MQIFKAQYIQCKAPTADRSHKKKKKPKSKQKPDDKRKVGKERKATEINSLSKRCQDWNNIFLIFFPAIHVQEDFSVFFKALLDFIQMELECDWMKAKKKKNYKFAINCLERVGGNWNFFSKTDSLQ